MFIFFRHKICYPIVFHSREMSHCLISLCFAVNNLQEKWRHLFDFLDIKRDGVLDMADIKLIQDNYARLHNLTAEEVRMDR